MQRCLKKVYYWNSFNYVKETVIKSYDFLSEPKNGYEILDSRAS